MEITVDGTMATISNVRAKNKQMIDRLDNIIQMSLMRIESRAITKIQSGIPPPLSVKTLQAKLRQGYSAIPLIRTGELLQSIRSEKTGAMEGVVGAFTSYAVYHEFGAPTIGIPQRTFMLPSLLEEIPMLQADLKGLTD